METMKMHIHRCVQDWRQFEPTNQTVENRREGENETNQTQ